MSKQLKLFLKYHGAPNYVTCSNLSAFVGAVACKFLSGPFSEIRDVSQYLRRNGITVDDIPTAKGYELWVAQSQIEKAEALYWEH